MRLIDTRGDRPRLTRCSRTVALAISAIQPGMTPVLLFSAKEHDRML